MLKRCTALLTALAVVGTLAACGPGGARAGDGRPGVVAAFYPLAWAAERVGGDAVAVQNLAKPGTEPHDLELSLRQAADVRAAKLVVFLKGFQPALDNAVAEVPADRVFDVAAVEPLAEAAGHHHEGEPADGHQAEAGTDKDPHLWLDPTRLATVADKLATRLGEVDAAHAADYAARARALRTELETLDREFSTGLATCERREIVTSHAAFGYLAARYKLEQIAITGLAPETEPSLARLAEVAAEAKQHGATTIFFETLVSPAVAQSIADKAGARTAVLDPVEGLQPGAAGDYLTVMRANLGALRGALGCS